MKMFCSYWPHLLRNHLSFLFLHFVFKFEFILKLNLLPKMGLPYAISIVNWIFGNILLEIIFWFSSLILSSIPILWKFQKFWTSGTCLKSASKLPTLSFFYIYFAAIFTMGETKNNRLFFLKPMTRKTLFVHRYSYDKWFCIKSC